MVKSMSTLKTVKKRNRRIQTLRKNMVPQKVVVRRVRYVSDIPELSVSTTTGVEVLPEPNDRNNNREVLEELSQVRRGRHRSEQVWRTPTYVGQTDESETRVVRKYRHRETYHRLGFQLKSNEDNKPRHDQDSCTENKIWICLVSKTQRQNPTHQVQVTVSCIFYCIRIKRYVF